MKRLLVCTIAIAAMFMMALPLQAKTKKIVSPDTSYDFKAVTKIVILPYTSDNVVYGKVDKDRLPKIVAILEKTKKTLRTQVVNGVNMSEPSIKFYLTAPDKKPTTLLLHSNIEEFDNGNMLARSISSFGGKAKVAIRTTFMDGKTKKVVAEIVTSDKASGGLIGGGLDSDALYMASKIADAETFNYLKKLTGLKYKSMANIGKKAKMGAKDYGNIAKEEKAELKSKPKKAK